MSGRADRGSTDRRLRTLRDGLHEARLDGLLVSSLPDIRYLCGFSGSSALLLVEPGIATLFTDFRYETVAREEVDAAVSVTIVHDGLFEGLAARLSETAFTRSIGFEAHHLTVHERQEIGALCGGVVWDPAPPLVRAMRAEKDAEEIGRIERAVAIAETALADVIPEIREGVSERELAAELEYRLRSAGSGPPPFETIVAAGPNAALPHHHPGDRRLGAGDLVLLDFGADFGGYCSDLTRTFVLGAPERWQREAHRAVREACRRGVEAATVGAVARDVDRAARDVLEQAGLGDRFGHGTGHGIGLEVHEEPRIHRRGEERLRTGNVVTIEPGVYLPGRGGIRIEEDVVVEEGGPRLLTSCSTELIEL